MRAIEEAVRGSGLAWTILRPGGFASNACAWAESVRAERTVAAPFGDVGIPVIDPADIGEVAAVALGKDEHDGHVYELNVPVAITPRQQAEAIGAALGEPVRFVELTRGEAHVRMAAFLPEPVVETTLAVLGEPNAAELRLSPDVERILGRAPHSFGGWARRNVEAFRSEDATGTHRRVFRQRESHAPLPVPPGALSVSRCEAAGQRAAHGGPLPSSATAPYAPETSATEPTTAAARRAGQCAMCAARGSSSGKAGVMRRGREPK